MHHFDIVIIGAGPAGAATALALRKNHPRLSVLLIESSDYQHPRPGETLSMDAVPLLQQLEVFDFFLEQEHSSLERHLGSWGESGNASRNASRISGEGGLGGWHVDRARFDSMLAGYAAASGASFLRANFSKAKLSSDGPWQITANNATSERKVSASFVVDASGRSARFATDIGVAQFAQDSLLGVVRVLECDDAQRVGTGQLIEAFEHGWWYSAPLSDRRLAVAVMTDADLCKRLQLTQFSQWQAHLQLAPQTSARLAGLKDKGEICVRAAHTRNLSCYAGNNWLAVGDAAASVDPLAAQGVLHALRFGMHAGNAIGEQFNIRLPDLKQYEMLVQAEFDNNLALRMEDYRAEQRWARAPFWERRHTAPSMAQHATTTGGEKKTTLSINGGRAALAENPIRAR